MRLRSAILQFDWDDAKDSLDIEVANWCQDITFKTPICSKSITPGIDALSSMLDMFVPTEDHGLVIAAILQVADDEMKTRLLV
ncbi:hypothetical protein Henu6_gp11 [Acinetobacter phage Henu6]|uniref:Uncharacterized protein n=1 Tax=Acinetobacter phage Henu6 TaxID=2500136 RepID=A0A410T531_9CAUD|nr:hypothetical protein Henu6_gp11 [Acinetobacter phage Henu6]